MNQVELELGAVQFAAKAVPLMKEYQQKLDGLVEESERLVASQKMGAKRPAKYDSLVELIRQLGPQVKLLAQHVSQMVEHGRLDDMTRLE